MDFHLGHTIAVLQRTPAALDALLRGLPDPWLHGDEGPDTWSPYVVVGHLIHQDETNWLPRAQTLLEHGEATVFADIDRFAQLKRFPNRPIGELLDLFARVRGDCLDRLEALKLSSEDLARKAAPIPASAGSRWHNCSPPGPTTTSATSARSFASWRTSMPRRWVPGGSTCGFSTADLDGFQGDAGAGPARYNARQTRLNDAPATPSQGLTAAAMMSETNLPGDDAEHRAHLRAAPPTHEPPRRPRAVTGRTQLLGAALLRPR